MSSRHNLLAVLACLLTCACATPRVVQDHQRDSVSVIIRDSVRYVDSLVLVPIPQGGDRAILPDSDTSKLETDIAESIAWVKGGQLHHILRNKDAAIIPVTIKMPERIHVEKEAILQAYKVTEIVEVEKKLSKWQRFLQSLGWTVLVGAVMWLAWKIYKFVK